MNYVQRMTFLTEHILLLFPLLLSTLQKSLTQDDMKLIAYVHNYQMLSWV